MLMGEIWSKLSLDTSDYMTNLKRAEVAGSNFGKGGFWQRFAAPALGFTVMYRAMNLLENSFKVLAKASFDTIEVLGEFEKQAISASGMLVTFAQSKNPFEDYVRILPAVKSLLLDLDRVAARHLITSEQLRQSWNAFLMKGVPVTTAKSLEDLAIITDTLMLVAKRGGSDITQVKTEIFALMDGQLARGADLYRLLVSIAKASGMTTQQFKDQMNSWKQMGVDAAGNNVFITNIAKMLSGMGASTKDLGMSREGVQDTVITAWKAIQIVGGKGVYEEIKKNLNDIVTGYKESGIHSKIIIDLATLWSSVMYLIYTLTINVAQALGLASDNAAGLSNVINNISVGLNGIFFFFRAIWEIAKAIRLSLESAFLTPIQQAIELLKDLFNYLAPTKVAKFLGLQGAFSDAADSLDSFNKKLYEMVPDIETNIKGGVKGVSDAFDDMISNSERVIYSQKANLASSEDMMKNYEGFLNDITKRIAAAGAGPTLNEEQTRERQNALIQGARLERHILAEISGDRRTKLLNDATIELELRKEIINKLKLTEKEKIRYYQEANDAYYARMKVLDGNYLDGMKRGYQEFFANLKTQYETGQDVVNETLGATKDLFHDSFLNLMKGDLNSFEDIFKSFSDRILDKWADMLADMVMEWIFGQSQMGESNLSGMGGGGGGILGILGGLIGGLFHEGGVAGMALENLPRLHGGLAPDEFPAILQKGERVTPKGINGKPQDNAPMFNILIQAADAKSFADLVRRNPQAILKPFMDAIERGDKGLLGRLRSA